jgi:hypothetical protein
VSSSCRFCTANADFCRHLEPTVLALDEDGRVFDAWLGQLSPTQDRDFIERHLVSRDRE